MNSSFNHASWLLLALLAGCNASTANGANPASAGGSSSRDPGAQGGAGSSGAAASEPLPGGTFLFTRRVAQDTDHLVARDLATGAERVVTDLTGDGSKGWDITGYALSKDRTKIAIASLYGPTKADTDTLLPTRRIWVLGADGKNFVRLTPVYKNPHLGSSNFRIDVRQPSFGADGATVFFDYGEQTGTTGGARVWSVATDGTAVPDLLDTPAACSAVGAAAVDPSSGKVLITQGVCANKADEGFVFFTADKQQAEMVMPMGAMSPSYEQPRWAADGSLFLFTAREDGGGPQSLFAHVMDKKSIVKLVAGASGQDVIDGALSSDGNAIVYCVRGAGVSNLHALDLTKDPPVDTALTTDGASCHPIF